MMDGLITGERGSYFTVGGALGRTLGLFGGELIKYMLLAALLLSPTLIYSLFYAPSPEEQVALLKQGIWGSYKNSALLGAASFFLNMLLQATVLYGAFQQMQGKGFPLGDSLKNGLARIPGVILVSLLVLLAMAIGLVLLIVPFLIVLCGLYVAVPVCVIERPGIVASLSRSWELTSGERWKIFGLVLAVGIGGAIIGGVIGAVAAIGGLKAVAIAGYLWQVIAAGFGAVLTSVVYYELRSSKEGVDVGHIASVFD